MSDFSPAAPQKVTGHQPKLAICVLVRGAKAGGLVAAPIAAEIFSAALKEEELPRPVPPESAKGQSNLISAIEEHAPKQIKEPVMTAEQAASLAAENANREARRKYDVTPFSPKDGRAAFKDGRWHWSAVAAFGKSDLQADVILNRSGSAVHKVEVKQLITIPTEPLDLTQPPTIVPDPSP